MSETQDVLRGWLDGSKRDFPTEAEVTAACAWLSPSDNAYVLGTALQRAMDVLSSVIRLSHIGEDCAHESVLEARRLIAAWNAEDSPSLPKGEKD